MPEFDSSIPVDDELQSRFETLESASTDVLVAIWRAIQSGQIDERSVIADAALRLRDALNRDWPANSNWLPKELESNPE